MNRSLALASVSVVVAFAALAPASAAFAESAAAVPADRAQQAVVPVIARTGAGAQRASGSGVFVDVGRLVVPRELLLGSAAAAVVIAGKEYPVTAVLADDDHAGGVLLSIDLPEGAPMPLRAAPHRADPGTHARVVEGSGVDRPLDIGPVVDVPWLGTIRAIEGSAPGNGAAAVDEQGSLLGTIVVREIDAGRVMGFVVPAERLAKMRPVAPLPLLDWSLQAAGRNAGAARACLRGALAALDHRMADAASAFDAAARLEGTDADAWIAEAECQRAGQQPDQVIATWRRAIAAQPSNPRFHHELGVALSDAGQWAAAANEFSEVTKLRPDDAEAQFNLGAAYGAIGRGEDEYRAYQATLSIDRSHLGALKNLGLVCLQLQRYGEAVESFTRAGRVAPADPEIQTGLGVAYFKASNVEAAVAALRRALQLAPRFVKAHVGLGTIYAAIGDRVAALGECNTLRAMDPAKAAQVCRLVEK